MAIFIAYIFIDFMTNIFNSSVFNIILIRNIFNYYWLIYNCNYIIVTNFIFLNNLLYYQFNSVF